MALELVGGAALGAVVGELLKAILDKKDKIFIFKSVMERLQSTLETINPTIEEIKRLDGELNDPRRTEINRLIGELEKGKDLVHKCSKIKSWDFYHKYRYSKRLLQLDDSLVRFFGLNVNAEIWRDTKQILVNFQEAIRKPEQLNLIEKSVMSGNVDRIRCWCAVPEISNFSVGMDVRIKELKTELFKDDVSIIGLCGLGGSGKTTLAAKLCQDEQVKAKFKDNILFLTVSSSPDLKVIVNGLFERLGDENGSLKFQNDEDAVKQLRSLMKQKEGDHILLVLDDVWSESFLQKFVFRTVRHKILVTSRTEYKLFDFKYSLKMLSDSDSMSLFRYLAFPQDESYEIPDEDCVKEIVSGCKGLPLTLKVIACSLRGEPARKWRSTERILRKDSFIFDTHTDLLQCLATSLDFLDDDVRECFLDFGLFSEDQRIPASVLIDIWIEFYELDEDDAYVNLLELSSRNLVNLEENARKDAGGVDGNLIELRVTQHDLLRELAIYKNRDRQNINQRKRLMMDLREDNIPKGWSEQDHRPFDSRLVCIHTDGVFSSGWSKMQFPKAEVLLLSFSTSNCILPRFIEKMSNLKVLIISYCGSHQLAKLSGQSSLCYLSQLKRLRLENIMFTFLNEIIEKLSLDLIMSHSIEEIAERSRLGGIMFPSLDKIIEPLKNMHKISLFGCLSHIGVQLNNISCIFPNLIEIDIDYCHVWIALPRAICKIRHLKKLSVTNCYDLIELPEQIGHLMELEVLRLRGCTGLKRLPDSIRILRKLRFLDISKCFDLESMPEGIGELCSLKKLDMRHCPSVRRLPISAMDLRHLRDVICNEEMGILWKTLTTCLPDLNIQVDDK